MRPPRLGTINGFCVSHARLGRKRFIFDGTTLGLVRAAIAQGAQAGDTIQADYGGGFKPMRLYYNPADERAAGLWAKAPPGFLS